MDRISGSFPGGPRRREDGEGPTPESERAFARVEDLSQQEVVQFLRSLRRDRAKRVLLGFLLALVLAGGVGFYVGMSSHRTAEELARQEEAAAQGPEALSLPEERRKVLQELWKMEDLEKAPRPPTSGR